MTGDAPPLPVERTFEGWEARFIGQDPRLSEVVEMYREIGYEVRIEQFSSDGCASCCKPCFDNAPAPHYVVYTRKGSEMFDDEELF